MAFHIIASISESILNANFHISTWKFSTWNIREDVAELNISSFSVYMSQAVNVLKPKVINHDQSICRQNWKRNN